MLLYSTTGGMWTYPVRITYSFIPDGTSIGGSPSKLYATMPSGWQTAIEKAAAVWEAATGINFVQVPDDGAPIGSNGDQQGDPNFGDIRFGGMPQSSSVLAFAFLPPAFNGGTNAGDIFFNTAQLWQTNGSNYDLMSCRDPRNRPRLGHGPLGDLFGRHVRRLPRCRPIADFRRH